MNIFLRIISNPLLRTDEINRYSGTYQATPELLSTHIVDVQYISLLIAKEFQRHGCIVDTGELLERGLLHDIDETLTGDFTRLVKYSSKECHDILEALAESVTKEISDDITDDGYLLEKWKNAKDSSVEGYIIRIADIMSVCKKISREVDFLGNNNFLKVALEVQNYLESLLNSIPSDILVEESVEYVKRLLEDSLTYLRKLVKENESVIDRLDLMNSTIKRLIENRVDK